VVVCTIMSHGIIESHQEEFFYARVSEENGSIYRCIIYNPNLGLGIAVSVQKKSKAALEGVLREQRGARGSM